MPPSALIARRHHIGVTGETEVRRGCADAREQVLDIGRALFREGETMHREARRLEHALQVDERAALIRRHRTAANQLARNRDGITGDHQKAFGIPAFFSTHWPCAEIWSTAAPWTCLPFAGRNQIS